MGRRTQPFANGMCRALTRGGAVGFGCGLWLFFVLPALAAQDSGPDPAPPEFADRLHGPAWTAAMQSAGVLSNGPAFIASPLERNPPPPASLFFNGRPIGNPAAPERFRQDTSSLESPIEPEAPAAQNPAAEKPAEPDEESAAPVPQPSPPQPSPPRPSPPAVSEERPARLSRPHRPTRHAAREAEPAEEKAEEKKLPVRHETRSREKAAHPSVRKNVARAPEPAPARQRQAAREPEPAPEPEPERKEHRPLVTGRSAAVKPPPIRPLVAARSHRPAAPVLRIAREPRVPVIPLPASLLPTQP